MDGTTSLYGIVGNPVGHSLSPVMHNSAFAAVGYNGAYLAFAVSDIAAALHGVRALGIGGVSVTIPFKESVMACLDDVDGEARRIGAVNTVINRDGVLTGYNYDAPGAVRALAEKTDIRGRDVVILGAGGAARAVGYGVQSAGGRPIIANRSVPRGEGLARELGARFVPLADMTGIDAPVLINTTSVGMYPRIDDMPVTEGVLGAGMVVMDIVYNPLETQLLKTARLHGCDTIDGVSMLVYQGALQFELWTGSEAPVGVMRQAVYDALRAG